MSIFKDFFGKGDEDIILEENKQLRKKRKHDKEDYEKLKEEYDDVVKKYISLLEEKGKGFDQYIHYHDLYGETYNLTKEQKKEIAELKMENRTLNETLEEVQSTLSKRDKEIEQLKNSTEEQTEIDVKEIIKGVEENEKNKK
ncbi:MAG: hypothetical protein MST00_06760 [Tenericutes bacterium]|nr:hypothetical protein [Mycoplasmatota bacterium]